MLFISCDPIRFVTGYVYDKETNVPIENVNIMATTNNTKITDSIGMWSIFYFGFYIPKNKYDVKFSKSGYVDQEVNLKNYNDSIIYLEREW